MALWLSLFCIACCAVVSYTLPLTDENYLVLYSKKIGSLQETSNRDAFAVKAKEAISTALTDSPMSTGLRKPGELENEAIAMMNMPLFGVTNNTERSARKKRHRPAPDMCQNSRLDAIIRTKSGSVFAFQGDHYWKLLENGIAEGYPSEIESDWDNLEGHLDAAFTFPTGETFFFKRTVCWKFHNKDRYEGYPKSIHDAFEGQLPNNIDAAFVWKKDNKSYVFKGSLFWQYDKTADPPVESSYPMPFSGWREMNLDYIDAAIQWDDDTTYFFKDQNYYIYKDENSQCNNHSESHSIAKRWFGCD